MRDLNAPANPLEMLAYIIAQQIHDHKIVYIGTGQYGDLPLTTDAVALLEKYAPVVKPTPDLLSLLEQEQQKYAAVLHVTC